MSQVGRFRFARLILMGGAVLLVGPRFASGQLRPGDSPESLGKVDFGASCDASVLVEFNRAVALLHHMTYPTAMAAFEVVTQQDPECALGYWGAAMTLFQPLWPNRPSPEDLRMGWELIQEARRRVVPDGRESMFVAAGEAFFSPEGETDYWPRIERWATSMTDLFVAYPDDREVRAFFALSHLATASRGDATAHHQEAAAVLTTILAEEPTHPGAVHYLIHANDFDGQEHGSLHIVRSYVDIAPANAHALHMPTHIFVRLGEWGSVIDWNRRAAASALRQRVGPNQEYVWDEFPHAVEYLVYAELQRADDASVQELIRSLNETPDLQPSFKTAFHLASTAVRYAIERRDWNQAAGLPVRAPKSLDWDSFPWPEALVWFARGLGATHLAGGASTAEESLTQLARLSDRAATLGEPVFADQISILHLEVGARQAFAVGDRDEALRLLEEAAALEESTPKHPVTPGPIAPARELLGDLYLEVGSPSLALSAYRASDARAPGRFNTILGLARASAALGDADAALLHYRALLDATVSSSTRAGALEARAYISSR